MAIQPLAASPPSVTSTSGVELTQAAIARARETSLTDPTSSATSTGVEVSETSRLLSSVAEIERAASAAEAGAPVDNTTVVEQAQLFVNSVNALNLGGQLSTDVLLDIAAEVPVVTDAGTSAEALSGNNAVLTLDSNALETALETNAAAATNQLAAIAAPVAETVATSLAEAAQLQATLPVPQATAPDATLAAQASIVQTATATNAARPVVEQAQLQEALADTVLQDLVSAATDLTGTQALTAGTPSPAAVAQANAATAVFNADTLAQPANSRLSANGGAAAGLLGTSTPNGNANPALTAATAAAQVETTLTPADLVTTPLEQIAQLARNPVVAGTVAAFQIPVDDSGRAARAGLPSVMETVNPASPVAATESIGPNLANNGNQRRDDSPDARANQWLATRPGLI